MSPEGIEFVGLTAPEADKVARLAGLLRDHFPAGRVVACHAVGDTHRALCFTRADGRLIACVAVSEFLAAADAQAVSLPTAFYTRPAALTPPRTPPPRSARPPAR